MKRKLKWLAIVLVVSLLGFGTALLLWPRDRITVESWKQIRVGMSQKEVEAILGEAGMTQEKFATFLETLEKNGKFPIVDSPIIEPKAGIAGNGIDDRKNWIGRHGCIQIGFDPPDHVSVKCFYALRSADPNLIDRLRDWLGW